MAETIHSKNNYFHFKEEREVNPMLFEFDELENNNFIWSMDQATKRGRALFE